jgi:hypothetical protein
MKNTIKVTLIIAAFLVSFGIFIPVLADTGSNIVDMMNDFTMGSMDSMGSMGAGHMSDDHQSMMDDDHMYSDHMDSEYLECMRNHMSEEDCDDEIIDNHSEYFKNNEFNEEECPHYNEEIHEDCYQYNSEN